MTDLRALMRESVDHENANMVRLAARARVEGTTLRRRRRARTLVASATVVAFLAAGVTAAGELLPGGPAEGRQTTAAGQGRGLAGTARIEPPAAEPTLPAFTGPLTPAGSVLGAPATGEERPFSAAGENLRAAVGAVLPGGTISGVEGQRILADAHNPETVAAELELAPGDGAPAGVVSVFHLTGGWGGDLTPEEYVEWCPEGVANCQVSTLPDGTRVKSFSQVLVDTPTGPLMDYRVERIVDGVVIALDATAGRADDAERSVLAPNPPLTMQQLIDVAALIQPLR